ncbi:MAG: diaminopimelate decarboxylase [Acetobacter sp.]|jgi:diaminopimelate decarboxylase|nr:diaminopimelate decarboxylase [Acetobacter sp.]MCH4088419.1 diaminopimelate decarboxylase [Acetobacter sp.]MCI1321089.1 diaminopimelate decarboxylase [Acetobacter sp.]MCI1374415.1 diaminopimelate decarboxylase [Acetobacter sp.]MCI1414258.1 diaminopimelate decarboxylase [Acetobacter sp.]
MGKEIHTFTDAGATLDPSPAELMARRPYLTADPVCGLVLEDVPLNAIADAEGTPVWVMSAGVLRERARRLLAAVKDSGLPLSVHFAVKSNDHLAVLRILALEGLGADVVSGGELARACRAGISPRRVIFSGVGKTDSELDAALMAGVAQINVESAEELEILSSRASNLGCSAGVALRVNPDVDAGTHEKITTGLAGNKFGIPYAEALALYRRAYELPGIKPLGFATHIGSQISSPVPFRQAYARIASLVRDARAAGLLVEIVDCGGGLGVSYRDETECSPDAFVGAIRRELGDLDVQLAMEPGRWISAPAGMLLSSVILRKSVTGGAPFIVIDAAMNDLARPSLYDAWHGLLPLAPHLLHADIEPAHLVGPVCESGDSFGRNRLLPHLSRGDRIALLDCGAYGSVMSSTYNARPFAAQVLVDGNRWSVIRPRQKVEELWTTEQMPEWLMPEPASEVG